MLFQGGWERMASYPASPDPYPVPSSLREVQRRALREAKDQDRVNKDKERELQRLEMEKRRADPLLSRK